MKSYQIDILNPKAARLLQDLADMKLISIKENKNHEFFSIISKFRRNASTSVPALEEITKEVESVRSRRLTRN